MYWSTSNRNILWQSQLDGSVVTPLLTDDLQTIGIFGLSHSLFIYYTNCISYTLSDDIAVDWISNKLYWTDNGQISRIGVLDIASGYYTSIINTGAGTNPRAIVVDPIHRFNLLLCTIYYNLHIYPIPEFCTGVIGVVWQRLKRLQWMEKIEQ